MGDGDAAWWSSCLNQGPLQTGQGEEEDVGCAKQEEIVPYLRIMEKREEFLGEVGKDSEVL